MASTNRTTRLDSIPASSPFTSIRLADGHRLTLKTKPGADTAEVFLAAGLLAPDTTDWQDEDSWDHWLTGGQFGDGKLYTDVPIAAVRDLITQHGGEHEDQSGADTAPEPADCVEAVADWVTTPVLPQR